MHLLLCVLQVKKLGADFSAHFTKYAYNVQYRLVFRKRKLREDEYLRLLVSCSSHSCGAAEAVEESEQ